MFKINNKDTKKTSLRTSLLSLNYFTPFLSFSVVEFKQANACWEISSHFIRLISALMCLLEEGWT